MILTNIYVYIVLITININFIGGQSFNGQECFHSKTSENGVCKFLKDCPEEITNLRRKITPQHCGFEGLEVVVCCPLTNTLVPKTQVSGDISKKKCQEYSQHVYTIVLNPTLLVGGGEVKAYDCFLEKPQLIDSEQYARRKEFPHIGIIGFGKTKFSDLDWLCTGSLISEKHLLTAAHCTKFNSGPPQKVRLGFVSLDKNDDATQEVAVDRFVNHPKYDRDTKYHDISILFLKNNVKLSAFIRPACLQSQDETNNSKLIVTGFGEVGNGNEYSSDNVLLKAGLSIIENEVCSQYISQYTKMSINITDQMICAGHNRQHFTCQSNSGGTLQVILKEPYCMYEITGVRSHGEFCGRPYSFSIYTKVDSYIGWIESTVWPEMF